MTLAALSPDEAAALVEPASDLRHDLGRYIWFELRFAVEAGDGDVLRAALRRDVLETRRVGDDVEGAASLWARLRPDRGCAALGDDPDVVAINESITRLAGLQLDAPGADLTAAAADARAVSTRCRSLLQRVRAAAEGAGD